MAGEKKHELKGLPYSELPWLSKKALDIHHDKLYAGYVSKRNEIEALLEPTDLIKANATYSELRELKAEETFAANGAILHEAFFSNLTDKPSAPMGRIYEQIKQDFGSYEKWADQFKACGMCARGWVILAHDPSDGKLHIYNADAHNQGGVWGSTPLLVLDVYEHAYFMDYGSDRKAYIEKFMASINWQYVDKAAEKAKLAP